MDETTENAQDTSERDSSGGNDGSTSKQPQTFTMYQMEQAKSDALSAAGRTANALEDRERKIAEREKSLEEWQRKQEEDEEDAARGDTGKLSALQQRRKIREGAQR